MTTLFRSLFVSLTVFLCSAAANAQTSRDFVVGNLCYRILSETDLTVEIVNSRVRIGNYVITKNIEGEKTNKYEKKTKQSTNNAEVVIPSEVTYGLKTYTVTSIGKEAFHRHPSITSIEIPNSITSIGEEAFRDCSVLKSIEIPNSVTNIGDFAFANCSSLKSIKLPNNVDNIKSGTFADCTSLKNIKIPNSVQSIEYYAFHNCSSLKIIEIPNSVDSIKANAFSDCSSLKSLKIPQSLKEIQPTAFQGCFGLKKICVDKYNPKYDSRNNCNAIIETETNTLVVGCKNTIIPKSVTKIGAFAFAGCSSLKSIVIPNSVEFLKSNIFFGCSSLTSIYMQSITPPSFDITLGDYSKTTLYVPQGSISAYKSSDRWKKIKNIQEYVVRE